MEMKFRTYSREGTADAAKAIADIALERGYVCLTGCLGAGKTAFTEGLVAALCPECLTLVHSPTFAIVNEYVGKKHSVFHFDLYRIKNEDDLYSTGFYDYADRNGIVVAEWSDLFPGCFPDDAIKVSITPIAETQREITVTY